MKFKKIYVFLTSHRRNELQLESTIRLIVWTHKHKDLEAFLKWLHAKAIRPYRPRLHDQNRNLEKKAKLNQFFQGFVH